MKRLIILTIVLALSSVACGLTLFERDATAVPSPETSLTPQVIVVTSTPTNTPPPSATSQPARATSVSNTGTRVSGGCSYGAKFVTDVNIPDGSILTAGQAYTKTWRIRNSGTCNWTNAFKFEHVNRAGSSITVSNGGVIDLPFAGPGDIVDVSVNFTVASGTTTGEEHRANFRFRTPAGTYFGDTPYISFEVGGTPAIAVFSSSTASVNASELAAKTARVPVSWQVNARPANTNLVFEQVLPDGTVRNIELPRDFTIIPSSGSGLVAPVMPGGDNPTEIKLRLRLVNLTSSATIVQKELIIPITEDDTGDGVEVVKFEASPSTVKNGDMITLSWDIRGADDEVISIFWAHSLMRFGWDMISTDKLSPTGTFSVEAPERVRQVDFILTSPESVGRTVTVTVNCRDNWVANPANWIFCPSGPQETIQAAYQSFEHGFMIWNGENIWVFVNGGSGFVRPDNWDGSDVVWGETPPDGLLQPVRGFGYLWANHADVRNALGWATAEELGYNMQVQSSVGTLGTYAAKPYVIKLPNGSIMAFDTGMGLLRWGNLISN